MNVIARPRQRVRLFIISLFFSACLVPVHGQDDSDKSKRQLIIESFNQKDYSRAIDLIDAYLEQSPNDVTMLYNLACAHCLTADYDAAATSLHRAIQAGFRDFALLRSDPHLSALRDHAIYRKILEEADKLAIKNARDSFEAWRNTHDDSKYTYETDNDRKIYYATSLSSRSHENMKARLATLAEHLAKSLFEEPPSYFVFIAVPTKRDARRIFNSEDSATGIYQHDTRRLIAGDTEMSLQHEFVHLMHYGHMERLGQRHAFWIQEGIATLYEKYEFDNDGTIQFLPNERDVIARNRVRAGRAIPWKELFTTPASEFMDNARRLYPEVRSIFRFIAERGLLESWYDAYVEQSADDPTGINAIEQVFNLSVDEVEKEWRQWVLAKPKD